MPGFGNTFEMIHAAPRQMTKDEIIKAVRLMVAAEYEAVQLYMQVADATDIPLVEKVFTKISDEERVHAGEFLRLLEELDPSENMHYTKGAEEVEQAIREVKKEQRQEQKEAEQREED